MHKIELTIRDIIDLLTAREVRKGDIGISLDKVFFGGMSDSKTEIDQVKAKVDRLLTGEKVL